MPTAARLVAVAEAAISYTESPPGSNRTHYAAEAGHANGQPWCATFVVAMARRIGLRLPNESAYAPTMFGGFANAGRGFRTRDGRLIHPGDIVFFDFPDAVDRIQHVGIAVSSTRETVTCVEGNTSSAASNGSQYNGGGVWRRTRPLSVVAAVGRPHYAEEAPTMPDNVYPAQSPVVAFYPVYNGATRVTGYYIITATGEVFGFGDAPYFGRVEAPRS